MILDVPNTNEQLRSSDDFPELLWAIEMIPRRRSSIEESFGVFELKASLANEGFPNAYSPFAFS